MTEQTEEQKSFEELIASLEGRVRKLEAGDLPLEQALKLFEEGIELTRDCHERLDAADRRIIDLESRRKE